MNKMIAAAALVAAFLFPARAFAQATHDHPADSPKATIVVSGQLIVGTTILQPGEYKFQCRTFDGRTFLVVTTVETGKEIVRVPCVREMLDAKVTNSEYRTFARDDGTRVLVSVRIVGESVAHRIVTD
jgi:hypothetical protein